MIASGYTMDLYCENEADCIDPNFYFERPQGQFTGETWNECYAQAVKRGWKISKKERTCYCPYCNGKI